MQTIMPTRGGSIRSGRGHRQAAWVLLVAAVLLTAAAVPVLAQVQAATPQTPAAAPPPPPSALPAQAPQEQPPPPPAAPPPRPAAPARPPVHVPAPPPVAVVCLDPGHGGKDAGITSPGISEKDLALAVCQRVKGLLEGRGYRVYLTRAGDFDLPVEERTGAANHRQAEAFVSVHADYGVSAAAAGARLYAYTEPAPETTRPGAAASTGAAWRKVSALVRSEGVRLARAVALGFEEAGSPAMAVREAPLAVLAGARMPAVVVEVGVLPAQAARLARAETQQELAAALARGIEIFFRPGSMPTGLP